jgi:hypothetical protein
MRKLTGKYISRMNSNCTSNCDFLESAPVIRRFILNLVYILGLHTSYMSCIRKCEGMRYQIYLNRKTTRNNTKNLSSLVMRASVRVSVRLSNPSKFCAADHNVESDSQIARTSTVNLGPLRPRPSIRLHCIATAVHPTCKY